MSDLKFPADKLVLIGTCRDKVSLSMNSLRVIKLFIGGIILVLVILGIAIYYDRLYNNITEKTSYSFYVIVWAVCVMIFIIWKVLSVYKMELISASYLLEEIETIASGKDVSDKKQSGEGFVDDSFGQIIIDLDSDKRPEYLTINFETTKQSRTFVYILQFNVNSVTCALPFNIYYTKSFNDPVNGNQIYIFFKGHVNEEKVIANYRTPAEHRPIVSLINQQYVVLFSSIEKHLYDRVSSLKKEIEAKQYFDKISLERIVVYDTDLISYNAALLSKQEDIKE